jgi:hypothetical protein
VKVIGIPELERLVRSTFPGKDGFSADAELGPHANRMPVISFVHGGPDPFLDRPFDAWLEGSASFVPLYQLLNRLCRAGVLAPGKYAVTRAHQGGPDRIREVTC